MKRREFLQGLAAAAAGMGMKAAAQAKPPRPNFVFILIDDFGWRDVGYHGSTFYETPNIDRLAAEGMRFEQAYAACPVCSPTRASIQTGKYPARLHLTDYIPGRQADGKLLHIDFLNYMPLEETTIAEALKDAGYETGFIGKWHLGDEPYWPEKQGYDVNIGGSQAGAPSSYFSPYKFPTLTDGPPGEYLNDRLTAEAERFIGEKAGKAPFLLFLAHYAVHTPLMAKPELKAKYEAKAAALPPSDAPKFIPEREAMVRNEQSHPVYAGMVENMDQSIGRVLKKLDEAGAAQNTVVIFMSDNGGLATVPVNGPPTSNSPLRAGKGWLYEGGIREPMIVRWPGVVKAGSSCETPVISTDFYPTMLELAGLPARPQQHCDGVSLAGLLRGGPAPERKAIFWHYPHYHAIGTTPDGAVRAGDWKLIRYYEDGKQELYNIKDDLSEKHDRAAQRPEKVAELGALLDAWLKETGATMPPPNPNWKPGMQNVPAKGAKTAKKAKAGQGKKKNKKA